MNLTVLCLTVLAALPIALGAGRYPEDMWQGHLADRQDQPSMGGARRASRRGASAAAAAATQPIWNDYTQSYNSVMGQNQGGYDHHQNSDAYSYSGDLSSFDRADDDANDVDTLSSARQLRKSQKQRLLRQQQQQQMSEIDDTESQLSAFGGLSLAGQMGSESDADSVFSINIRPGGAMGGASTARLPRGAFGKGKGSSFLAGGASDSGAEPQSARVRRPGGATAGQGRRAGVMQQGGKGPAEVASGGGVTVDQQVNDPRLWQLFNKVWAGHSLDFQVDPKDLAVNIMRIRHALECPEAIERIAFLKVQSEAPKDERNYLGAYIQWMDYWKKVEVQGGQILTTAESDAIKAQMGMAGGGGGGGGGGGSGEYAGGSGGGKSSSSYGYAPLIEKDSVNKAEARAVWSVFRQNQMENAFPDVPSKEVSIGAIEELSWGLQVADYGRDKTEALLRMFLEKAVKRSQDELAEFDAARMLKKQDWEAQVQAKKEEVLRRGSKSRKGRS